MSGSGKIFISGPVYIGYLRTGIVGIPFQNRDLGGGAILGPIVRSVLNGAIFNRFASNLDCTHDFKVSQAGEQERQIWGQCVLWGFNPFWDTKIRRSHIYGTCASMDLKFGRLLLHNDV